jgi:predicted amidophosphoribosyltransferase
MNCLICEKELFSEVGIGCRLCGMPLEEDDEFCCKDCSMKYVLINGEIN